MSRSGISRRGLLKLTAASGVAIAPLAVTTQHAAAEPTFQLPPATDKITPFRLRVPDATLRDLRARLAATRWPEAETDPTQGAHLARVRRLVQHWQHDYDWRKIERRLNNFGQFRTKIDGLGIHFLHVRSRHENAIPLLLTHGWPGSVLEFAEAIGPLTDPTAHGGQAQDAFHVIVPSLPGYGFSDRPAEKGWGPFRTARAWGELMRRLGYDRFIAQGGDWGAGVSQLMASIPVPGIVAVHINFAATFNPPVSDPPTPEEQEALDKLQQFANDGSGYFSQQSTRPQTVGYGLADSPTGQAAWIFEKFVEWTDSGGQPEQLLGFDRLLDDIMLYWLPNTATSSARFYWEAIKNSAGEPPVEVKVPLGFSQFPEEIAPTPKIWAERIFKEKLVYYNKVDRGGHFAAMEQPALFTEEMRKFARLFR